MGTTLKILEESTQHANLAEICVGLTKTSIRKYLRKSDTPMVLWDFCAERQICINNLADRPLFQLQGQNLHLSNLGEEREISSVCQLKLHDWAYAMDGAAKFPN